MHGASFLGVYVCVHAHAHTHMHSSQMEVRKRLSGVISLLSWWFQDPAQMASTVAMPLPTEPSCWPMSIFLSTMLWVSWLTTVCFVLFFMCVSVCTCLCGCMHVWIGVFACVWVCACMDRCVCTCVGVCMQKSEVIEVSVRHLSFSIALHLSFETEYQ